MVLYIRYILTWLFLVTNVVNHVLSTAITGLPRLYRVTFHVTQFVKQ